MSLPYENATSGASALDKCGRKLKTHCLRGHVFDQENTLVTYRAGAPSRHCRACARDRAKTKYHVTDRIKRAEARMARIEEWKREVSPADLAWAAGHFEGEGTISLSAERRDGYCRPLASLASTDRQVIAYFDSWWPTSIAGKKSRIPTPNARPVWRWEINSAVKVRAFIDQIRPHLRTIRCQEKFDLVSEFTNLVLAPHEGKVKQRHPEYIARIRELNHRGSSPFLGQILLGDGKTVLDHVTGSGLLRIESEGK